MGRALIGHVLEVAEDDGCPQRFRQPIDLFTDGDRKDHRARDRRILRPCAVFDSYFVPAVARGRRDPRLASHPQGDPAQPGAERLRPPDRSRRGAPSQHEERRLERVFGIIRIR